ncbi:hypothetical protein ILUMI_18581 [Ignelater luminosus]|uniref:Mos1 transposase HTH domain-containing protein n=1 Tax=Ignelater luminosus TaxID=2038154 RepID=A0A8K0G403_IGNLU|nr:hypothetical protein ILUMI_18581 [Ignelater luminosus]
MMKQVYGDDCLSRTRVNEWFKRFHEGREDILDDEHPGPSKTVATEKNRPEFLLNNDDEIDIFDITLAEEDEISVPELKNALKTMKNGRAPGPSGILVKLLKDGTDLLLELRRCCRLTLHDRVKNTNIREEINLGPTVIDTNDNRKLRSYGHLRRMGEDIWPKWLLDWNPTQRRRRGRPRRTWIDGVTIAMTQRNLRWRLE